MSIWEGKLFAREVGSNESTSKAMRPWRGVAYMRNEVADKGSL